MRIENILFLIFLLHICHRLDAKDALKHCPAGEHLVSGKCELCPPGTYRAYFPISWYQNYDDCKLCPKGTFQKYFGAVGPDLCIQCPVGTFSTKEGTAECEKCPEGYTSIGGLSECIECPAGSIAVKTRHGPRCQRCKKGWYRALDMHLCEICPDYMTTDSHGAVSKDECIRCEKGNDCYKCDYHNFRPSWDSRCYRCPRGTYSMDRSASSLSECLPCPKGTIRTHDDWSCRPCKMGNMTGPGGSFCKVEGVACPKRYFENSVGDCETCLPGYRLNRALLKCEKCPPGSASRGRVTESCHRCPENQVLSPLESRCECLPGSYLKGKRCVRCPVGTAKRVRNRDPYCYPCYNGRAPERGMTKCIPCEEGTVFNFDLDKGRCERCGKHQRISTRYYYPICLIGRTGCPERSFRMYKGSEQLEFSYCEDRACTEDTPVEDIGIKCQLCKKGNFVARHFEWWMTEKVCKDCQDYETSEGGFTTECIKCPFGQTRNHSTGDCECGQGVLQNGDSCTFCPPGSSSDDRVTCTECEPGFYANEFTITCRRCEKGTYSPGNVALCLKCPPGTTPNDREAATGCEPIGDV